MYLSCLTSENLRQFLNDNDGICNFKSVYIYYSCTIKQISIFGSCLPEPGKCPGKPLTTLSDWPSGPIYQYHWYHISFGNRISLISIYILEIFFKPRSYPTSINEETTVVIISSMNFCNFKSYPFDTLENLIWWLILKPYLHSGIANGFLIYRGHNPKNRPIPILVYSSFNLPIKSLRHIRPCNNEY